MVDPVGLISLGLDIYDRFKKVFDEIKKNKLAEKSLTNKISELLQDLDAADHQIAAAQQADKKFRAPDGLCKDVKGTQSKLEQCLARIEAVVTPGRKHDYGRFINSLRDKTNAFHNKDKISEVLESAADALQHLLLRLNFKWSLASQLKLAQMNQAQGKILDISQAVYTKAEHIQDTTSATQTGVEEILEKIMLMTANISEISEGTKATMRYIKTLSSHEQQDLLIRPSALFNYEDVSSTQQYLKYRIPALEARMTKLTLTSSSMLDGSKLPHHSSYTGSSQQLLELAEDCVDDLMRMSRVKDIDIGDILLSLYEAIQILSQIGAFEQVSLLLHPAITICVTLKKATSTPDLVDFYHTNFLLAQATNLSCKGQYTDALKISNGAVELCTRLVDRQSSLPFRECLADSFLTMSTLLVEEGQHVDALPACEKAVDLYWQLVKDDDRPDLKASLADALTNWATMFDSLGRAIEGLIACEIGVKLLESLLPTGSEQTEGQSADKPADPFQESRATAITRLAIIYYETKNFDEALKLAKQSVCLFRELRDDQRDRYSARLAWSLGILSLMYRKGRDADETRILREEARVAAEESVELFEQLFKKEPRVYRSPLAWAHNKLLRVLDRIPEQSENAMIISQRSVRLHLDLFGERPNSSRKALTKSLGDLSKRLDSGFSEKVPAVAEGNDDTATKKSMEETKRMLTVKEEEGKKSS